MRNTALSVNKLLAILSLFSLALWGSCSGNAGKNNRSDSGAVSGELIIFHAGSLSAPVKQISRDFELAHPGVRVLLEAAGSVDCARKITELKKPCDIMASSDYKVIENFLIPAYTGWHIPFAANEMVIAFTGKSGRGNEITQENWAEILRSEDIRFGRADPASDPCGYRTSMVFDLAERHMHLPGLADQLRRKDNRYIRPKEVDLLALLDVDEVDYIFIYRSVAMQHHLSFFELPDEINLKNPGMAELYRQVSVKIPSGQPGDSLVIQGEPMVYSVTMIDAAPNPAAAIAFLEYMLDGQYGMKTIESMGQRSVIPAASRFAMAVPGPFKKFIINDSLKQR